MSKQRKQELDLYRLYAKDDAFYQAFFDTMKRMASVDR
jgi:type I restriction enzyme R subunit